MKKFLILAVITFGASLPFLQAADKELEAARARFDAAMTAATLPVRERYLQELQQMKGRAISQKNLDLAVQIDNEIKAVAPQPDAAAVKTREALELYLADTTWSWGVSENSASSRLNFRRDGTCAINKDKPVKWSATDDSTVKLENGTIIKFSANNKSFTATTPTGNRVGKKL